MDTSIRPILPPKPKRINEKADEVRRRKEAAERLIKEKHEAVRRQHEEKIRKIHEERLRQQRELKERHAKELKRQQDVLQRRLALMERDNARKKEILEKNHAATSRLVTGPSRKKYAFGSSTPRELSFVECRQFSNQEKHVLREKQVLCNGAVHGQRDRSAVSAMSTSLYVPSDNSCQSNSTSRLSHSKTTPTKSHNLMTQSVCITPISRLRRKPLSQLTTSVPNSPQANLCPTPGSHSKMSKTKESKVKPKVVAVTIQNCTSSSTERPNEIPEASQSSSEHFNEPVSVGASPSESLYIKAQSDDIASNVPDIDAHTEDEINAALLNEDVVSQDADNMSSNPSAVEVVQTSEEDSVMHEIGESEIVESEESGTNDMPCLSLELAQATTFSPIQENVSVSVGELGGGVQAPVLPSSHPSDSTIDNVSSTKDQAQELLIKETARNLLSENLSEETLPEVETNEEAKESVKKETVANSHYESRTVEFLLEDESNEQAEELHDKGTPKDLNGGEQSVEFLPEDESNEQTKELRNTETIRSLHGEDQSVETSPEGESTDQAKELCSKETTRNLHCGNRTVEFVPENEAKEQANELLNKGDVRNSQSKNQPAEFLPDDEVNVALHSADLSAEIQDAVIENNYKVTVADSGINAYSDGAQKQFTPIISGDIPGTVPVTKEINDSIVKRLPSPHNEIIAHRLRREQEQRELDERKARIAAILAKSRDLSNATPLVIGRTSPTRGETAQDLLKRLASNGNLPSLQKLVARNTSEPSAIDQITQDDPTPQPI